VTAAGVAARVSAAASGTRLMVVVDDVDLLDGGSARVLLHLAGAGATVVATARSAPLPGLVESPWRDGHCERIELAGLSDEAGELLEAMLGGPADLAAGMRSSSGPRAIRCCCASWSRPRCRARCWSGAARRGFWTGSRRGTADPAGTADRGARLRRPFRPGHRRPAAHLHPHGPDPPGPHLRQTRHQPGAPSWPPTSRVADHGSGSCCPVSGRRSVRRRRAGSRRSRTAMTPGTRRRPRRR
jgi:hypothetical protein